MKLLLALALVPGLTVGLYFWFGFGPYIEPHRVFRSNIPGDMAKGWEVLQPWAAWPIVAVYSTPVFMLAVTLAVLLAWVASKAFKADERRILDRHNKAATERMREANRLIEEAKRARQIDQAIVTNVKRDNMHLSRQSSKDNSQRISAVGELKRRRKRDDKLREQLAEAHREIERLKRALPPESEAQ